MAKGDEDLPALAKTSARAAAFTSKSDSGLRTKSGSCLKGITDGAGDLTGTAHAVSFW
jgi:hypothetical protein